MNRERERERDWTKRDIGWTNLEKWQIQPLCTFIQVDTIPKGGETGTCAMINRIKIIH